MLAFRGQPDALALFLSPSIIPPSTANTAGPNYTAANRTAGLANGGSSYTDASDPCPKRAAAESDFRDHCVRLSNRRGCDCLRRCCEGKGKTNSSNHPDHFLLLSHKG